ncbi:ABC transporter permease [Desulfosporosinus lacus]|uniref:Putative ABC transport system permease protein n=1 Tax=Desulfosporosinus lacus DSM 15449 TaxID=1121420 RepID=A0A1M5QTA8_9FIRM|nr:ABC transporter permease [Desulfosporosinus lacus]SHH17010.1 putative ABC transport system permease protein [Desulfosporosinus lacus DSM 15449]
MTLTDIAIQNLRRRKGKTTFLVLTFVLVISITVALNTLAKSMHDDLQKSLTQYGANVVITPKSEHFTLSYGGLSVPGVNYEVKQLNYDSLARIKSNPDLAVSGIAPKIIGSVTGAKKRYLIIGVDFPNELKMKPWWQINGRQPGDQEVIIGSGIASKENLGIGSTLALNHQNYPIVGIMEETGGSEDNGVFTNFSTSRALTGIDSWSMIELNTAQPNKTAAYLSELLPEAKVAEISQLVQGAKESVDRFSNFSLITSIVLGVIGVLIVFVTTYGNINDRVAELGILQAIGFRRRHIYSILIREIVLVSLSGGVLGYLSGELTPILLGPIAFQKTVSFQFNPLIALTAISASLLVGIVSIFLARRAISLNPLEALSYI